MSQIYASHISVTNDLILFLKSIKDSPLSGNFCDNLTQYQYALFNREDFFSLNLYYFHILVFYTKKQNHIFSHLDESFFNSLSPYKDKLKISFHVSGNSLVPYGVHYNSLANKTNINLKKNIIRLFSDSDIHIKENSTKKTKNGVTKQNTSFLFQ